MNKEELRLAVVIYGGASLAVYMHGVTKELLKLVQASKRVRDEAASGGQQARNPAQPDTGDLYADLLRDINRSHDFRVVIDVIAGASAGAITGAMLGKALANNRTLDRQTDIWLRQADIDHLADERGGRWYRWYLRPFLKILVRLLPAPYRSSPETRRKLEKFMRMAWLSPPLSGARLCHMMFDALAPTAADTRAEAGALLPAGQKLDFYASITDLFGYPRSLRLNEQTVAKEQEHAVVAWLSHEETPAGRQVSDFRDAANPALVWSARASSSYAGAFAPFHHSEMLGVLRQRQLPWDADTFLTRKLLLSNAQRAAEVFDPADRYFVDGGIVNNKPFASAMNALQHRPTDRSVERCILYIEPTPNSHEAKDPQRFLRFLGTVRAAASSIPRNQPILAELNEVAEMDAKARINRRLAEHNRPVITALAGDALDTLGSVPLTAAGVAALRQRLSSAARQQMGIAFDAYEQRRVWYVSEAMVNQWRLLLPEAGGRETERAMMSSVEQWLAQDPDPRRDAPHTTFLRRFDVNYRIRRLQFVIRSMNLVADLGADGDTAGGIKQSAYELLQAYSQRRRPDSLHTSVLTRITQAGRQLPLTQHDAVAVLRLLSRALGLGQLDDRADALVADGYNALSDSDLGQRLIADYTGFAYYDVLLTASGTDLQGTDPLTRIRLERISPEDAPGLQVHFRGLASRNLMSFAGFFNRSYREHDYLWGRLNGADRIVDLLSQAAGPELLNPAAQHRLRLALFNSVIDSETPRLASCTALLARLRAELRREANRPS